MEKAIENNVGAAPAESTEQSKGACTLPDGTVYSRRKNFCSLSIASLERYAALIGHERIERLQSVAGRLKGLKLLELNATAQGGGVAEMLYSSVPFLNELGIENEWKVIAGSGPYYECTKTMHNLLQGMDGSFTPEMKQTYLSNLEDCASTNLIDYNPEVVTIHDPQPMCLTHYLGRPHQIWLWRCHIDIQEAALMGTANMVDLISDCIEHYDGAIFSAAQHVISRWPMPKFVIPPFIDPFSEKNRELTRQEIDKVLTKYHIDPKVPIIAQIGRFDPWKGLDRTIAVYRRVREEKKCQLVIAGGMAADDPEGGRILDELYSETENDEDVHILNLSLANRLENYLEVNALQRAATVIMQPSTREGFGLVVTEAMWKGKPVIGGYAGAIPIQIKAGDTGYFYQNTQKTARQVSFLLTNPQEAELTGQRAKRYVETHFLLPDRICDYLMAIDMALNSPWDKERWSGAVISYHPWFKH